MLKHHTTAERITEGPWTDFTAGDWSNAINVRDFIQTNYAPYQGDGSFLAGPTERTDALWAKVLELYAEEREKGVLDVDPSVPARLTAFGPGYIDKASEKIVGLQTDAPLKRAIFPNGGVRMVDAALEAYGYAPDPDITKIFTDYRKTHNQGVFDAYTPEILMARRSGIVTGLPDAYGRGRIIGDYRRVALYGVDMLVSDKQDQLSSLELDVMTEETIRLREEISDQIKALKDLKAMAQSYGIDISQPAQNAYEAVQWTYFGYLGAIKDQNGAAMSVGRIATFLDIYIERDLAAGVLTESDAQELMDDLVIKLRLVRFLRTPDYNALFTGDPIWATECLGWHGRGRPAAGHPLQLPLLADALQSRSRA